VRACRGRKVRFAQACFQTRWRARAGRSQKLGKLASGSGEDSGAGVGGLWVTVPASHSSWKSAGDRE
jgi:hypothetical protein